MKIISIKWKHGSSDFVHVVTNADGADKQYRQLKAADTEDLFDIAVFSSDGLVEALDYIKSETASHVRDVAADKHSTACVETNDRSASEVCICK